LISIATVLLAAYLVVWWVSLRIVIDPSWPPPADAVTPAQARAMTEAFVQRDDLEREDVAIPYALATASDVRLYLDGPEFFPAILEDIAAARHSIHMMMFGMTDGTIAETFTTALADKATQGVEVRVILDAYGAKVTGESKPYLDRMTAAGVQIVVNHEFPLDRDGLVGAQSIDWQGDEVGESDHRKAFVIDGVIGWVGGAGLQDHFNGGTFLDTFARVEGSIVLQMQAVFLTSFAVLGGPVESAGGSLAAFFPEPDAAGTIRATLLQNVPGGFLPGTQASQAIIEHATERLEIMNPYFTDPGMLDRIVDAAHRGVHVRLVISAKTNNGPADDALKHHYQRLLDAGVEIWEYPVTVHAKVTIADDAMIIGTINYDAWALYRNLEIGILIEDAAVADRGVAELTETVIARSVPGEVPDGAIERVRNWMWDKLTYFL
jgi:cardiolipin synthase